MTIHSDIEANKALVRRFYEKVICGGDLSLTDEILEEGYIQHNPKIPTGREGFKTYFSKIHRRFKLEVEVLNMVADGDMVVIHVHQTIVASSIRIRVAAMDRFRIHEGKIAEHWDVISGVGFFDRLILEIAG